MSSQEDYPKAANRFYPVAQRFCFLVDSAAALDKSEFLTRVYRTLPELIGEAMLLPEVVWPDDDDEDEESLMHCQDHGVVLTRHEDWSALYNSLKEKLGDWDLYWQVFDPIDKEDHEVIYGTLADDIAGVYGNLKDGIILKECGRVPMQEVVFKWRNDFFIHWGRHAINALRTMHFLLQDKFTGLDEPV
jgi:uncharacterized protein DUF5063